MKDKKKKNRTKLKIVQPRYEIVLRRLIAAVHDAQAHRQMNAAEPPETQDAWDRLKLAVLESEQRLALSKPLDKRRR